MKKIISVLISLLLIIACGACAKEEPKADDVKDSATAAVSDSIKNETTTGNISEESSENSDEETENNNSPETLLATRIEAGADGFISPVEKKTEVPEGYIGIHNAQEFDSIRYNANANYILMADIDLSEFETWKPIEILNGELDGNGYAIKGLSKIEAYVNRVYAHAVFYKANSIKNLAIIDAAIEPVVLEEYKQNPVEFGTFAVIAENITNCYSTGKISVKNIVFNNHLYIGGLCAYTAETNSCYSACDITVDRTEYWTLFLGGLFGISTEKSITNSYFDGKINVTKFRDNYIGGITGQKSNGMFTNCRSSGEINVVSADGFSYNNNPDMGSVFVGAITAYSTEDFDKCYSNTNISVNINGNIECQVGGIVGNANQRNLNQCYNTGNISVTSKGNIYCGGIAGKYGFGMNWSRENSVLSDCFNTGTITANSAEQNAFAGGISGYISGQVNNCYNTGVISGTTKSGAIAGDHDVQYTKLLNCYYTNTDIGALGVNALFESVKMLTEEEAKDSVNYAGFSFTNDQNTESVWTTAQNSEYKYPTLTNLYFEQ